MAACLVGGTSARRGRLPRLPHHLAGNLPSKATLSSGMRSLGCSRSFRKLRRIAFFGNRVSSLDPVTDRYVQVGEGAFEVEADHAVHMPPDFVRLESEVAGRRTRIERMGVRRNLFVCAGWSHDRVRYDASRD